MSQLAFSRPLPLENRNQSSWIVLSAHNIALLMFEVLGIKASVRSSSHVAANVLC